MKNHTDAINDFIDEVIQKYHDKLIESGQMDIVEQLRPYSQLKMLWGNFPIAFFVVISLWVCVWIGWFALLFSLI